MIRKTVISILQQGFREKFKDRDARDDFWLYEYALDKKQSKKQLRDMKDSCVCPKEHHCAEARFLANL
jgi:hypothetical protein